MLNNTIGATALQLSDLSSLADLPIWVAWMEVLKPGKTKPDKLPVNPETGRLASTSDAATWAAREAADARAATLRKAGAKGGVGLILGPLPGNPGWRLCGVDLDGCRSADGSLTDWAEIVVKQFASYAEISPSGGGLHVLFFAREADVDALTRRGAVTPKGGAEFSLGKHVEVAMFLGGRYFTCTGDGYDPTDFLGAEGVEPIRAVGIETLEWLAEDHGPAFKRTKGGTVAEAEESVEFVGGSGDQSTSGFAYRAALVCAQWGMGKDEAAETLAEDGGEAGQWWAKSSDRDRNRCLERAFAYYAQERARLIALFDEADDLPPMGDAVRPSDLGGYAPDQDGVIRAFTDWHKGELIFDHSVGKWFRFDGNLWRLEGTKLASHYARMVSTALAARDPKAKALNNVATWEAVERGARTVREFARTAEVWNRDPWLLGTPGGTVDLRTGLLRQGAADDHISKSTAVAPIPLGKFRADRDCPKWLAFLDQALASDAEAIRFLQTWGGYSLTGDTREQVLLFVYGPGGSGKGTAINTIADVIGEYAVNVGMETLTASKNDRHLTELARLHGARMARASETEKGRGWAENRIKALTGQDKVTANFMRQDHFEFLPEFKLTIFGNNRPTLKDVDAAIKRRFMVLPFDHPPVRKDERLPEKLKAEWPGILSWLIEGCLEWQAKGLRRPKVVQAATAEYFAEQDTFGQWITDCCSVDPRAAETTNDLWDSWSSYAYSLGEDAGSRNRTFPETLAQRGFEPVSMVPGTRSRGYRGLRLLDKGDKRFDSDEV